MPHRKLVTKEMAAIFGVFSHPARIEIIEELRGGDKDVNQLQDTLEVSHSRVSQHLSVLRTHRLVTERREGRHVFYRLTQPALADWLLGGLQFLEAEANATAEIHSAIQKVREMWVDADKQEQEAGDSRTPA